ncbi:hypothetical protein ACFE04_017874 [Oxalis oulophora]
MNNHLLLFFSRFYKRLEILRGTATLLSECRFDGLPLDSSLSNGVGKHDDEEERLKNAVLEVANKSWAPYSESPSGVALMDMEGMCLRGETIVAAVLVGKGEAKIKQEDTTRLFLRLLSPKCASLRCLINDSLVKHQKHL